MGLELEMIEQMMQITRGQMSFQYLGVPLAATKLRVIHYAPLINKIE